MALMCKLIKAAGARMKRKQSSSGRALDPLQPAALCLCMLNYLLMTLRWIKFFLQHQQLRGQVEHQAVMPWMSAFQSGLKTFAAQTGLKCPDLMFQFLNLQVNCARGT